MHLGLLLANQSELPFTSGKLCLHDWVWGLCEKCGTVHSASTLRNMFSERDLSSLTALSCIQCIEHHAKKKKKVGTDEKLANKASTSALENLDLSQEGMLTSSTHKPASHASRSSTPASASKIHPEGIVGQEAASSTASEKERARVSDEMDVDPPATVAPILRLKIGLADPQDGKEVDVLLNGDNAKCFFGKIFVS